MWSAKGRGQEGLIQCVFIFIQSGLIAGFHGDCLPATKGCSEKRFIGHVAVLIGKRARNWIRITLLLPIKASEKVIHHIKISNFSFG